ncbi:hypothetical protein QLQ09_05395 [Brucella sp. NM4]|uniref:hypothetical protein n=1 Tax=Brucella sp. NM4 TaxID=3045175 RepID=UPI0024BD143D|nr:hypothetical protein [Brucella sp. NM4]WHS29838.1 hypothetical protein QLQ09_05395 [Brucella sp. NM4]
MNLTSTHEMSGNLLLMMLNEEDRQKLLPHTVFYELEAEAVLQKAGDDVVHTWFPCGAALASFQRWVDEDNSAVEIALIGREGAVGGDCVERKSARLCHCHRS